MTTHTRASVDTQSELFTKNPGNTQTTTKEHIRQYDTQPTPPKFGEGVAPPSGAVHHQKGMLIRK